MGGAQRGSNNSTTIHGPRSAWDLRTSTQSQTGMFERCTSFSSNLGSGALFVCLQVHDMCAMVILDCI